MTKHDGYKTQERVGGKFGKKKSNIIGMVSQIESAKPVTFAFTPIELSWVELLWLTILAVCGGFLGGVLQNAVNQQIVDFVISIFNGVFR